MKPKDIEKELKPAFTSLWASLVPLRVKPGSLVESIAAGDLEVNPQPRPFTPRASLLGIHPSFTPQPRFTLPRLGRKISTVW